MSGEGGGDPYDPLVKLERSRKALLAAGARGEDVGPDLRAVENSIREIIEQREAQRRPRHYERDR